MLTGCAGVTKVVTAVDRTLAVNTGASVQLVSTRTIGSSTYTPFDTSMRVGVRRVRCTATTCVAGIDLALSEIQTPGRWLPLNEAVAYRVTIANNGTEASPAATLRLEIGGNSALTIVPRIPGGDSAFVPVALRAVDESRISATIDPDGLIEDRNRANNSRTVSDLRWEGAPAIEIGETMATPHGINAPVNIQMTIRNASKTKRLHGGAVRIESHNTSSYWEPYTTSVALPEIGVQTEVVVAVTVNGLMRWTRTESPLANETRRVRVGIADADGQSIGVTVRDLTLKAR